MKKLANLLVIGSSILLTVNGQCTDRQILKQDIGVCEPCPEYQRAQSFGGNPNYYCQEDACKAKYEPFATTETYINLKDGTCSKCPDGQVAGDKNPSAYNLRTQCVSSSSSGSVGCQGCLQYVGSNGQCITCNQLVVNVNKDGCTYRQNLFPGQYYDSCGIPQNCPQGTTYDNDSNQCVSTTNNNNALKCLCNAQAQQGVCIRCPEGQTSDNSSGTCQTKTRNCHANGQIELDQKQCYACQDCPAGQVLNQVTKSCYTPAPVQQTRPLCSCDEQYQSSTNTCEKCPTGQLSQNTFNKQDGICQYLATSNPTVCNPKGLIQLPQNECYECMSCSSGQVLDPNTNQCVQQQIQKPLCECYEEYDQGSNTCVRCQAGYLSGNSRFGRQDLRCAYSSQSQTCSQSNQLQGSQDQCYGCQGCLSGYSFTNGICQRPRPTCQCYEEYDQINNRCNRCPTGQLSNNSNFGTQDGRCAYQSQNCAQSNQLQGSQDQCYQCQGCLPGYQFINNSCQKPKPSCQCYEEYDQLNNICKRCPTGQISGNGYNRQDLKCQTANNQCARTGELTGTQEQCYACLGCPTGQQKNSSGICQRPRPTCQCYEEYDSNSNSCRRCPDGSLSGNYSNGQQDGRCTRQIQNCNSQGKQQLGQESCYACQDCPFGTSWVNGSCRAPRPQCSCTQEYNAQTNQCDECPIGSRSGNSPSNQSQRCSSYPQSICNQRGQIQLGRENCYECQSCRTGEQLVGNTCQVPKPICGCYQEYNSFTNQCDTCPDGYLSNNISGGRQDLRCQFHSQICNQQGQRQLGQTSCYRCSACPTGQQLEGNQCVVPKPTCNCDQQYNPQFNRCDQCPAGQLSGNSINRQDGRCQTFQQTCNQNGQIQLGQSTCYACQACANLNEIIIGNKCVVRASCLCYQEYNAQTNTCRNCPMGQLANPNTGRCEPATQSCNLNGQQQLGQQQCYNCQACPSGQTLVGNNCVVPRPQCQCYQFVNSNNQCENCPANQLADSTNSRCVQRQNSCQNNQIYLDQFSCYQCFTCGQYELPNTQRTECIPRPKVNCGCLSRRDYSGYQCIPCPTGEYRDPNNVEQCIPLPVCDEFSYRLPRDGTSCGACKRCNWPSQVPDPITQSRCITRPRPSCKCTQRYGDQGYSCFDCPYGQIRSRTNQEECVNPQPCSGNNQIQLVVDNVSCGNCQTCEWPRFIPDVTKTTCVARPIAECPDCTTKQSADGYSCEQCPAGQIKDPNNQKRCITPVCSGTSQIRHPINNIDCGRFQRPFATCNSCTQRQSDDGYSCVNCPAGQIQDPNNSRVCYAPVCFGMYDIQLRIDNRSCGKCQACNWPQEIPNNEKTACVRRPYANCPSCLERQSDDRYSCEQCPYGQTKDPTNPQRCITITCSGERQIQQPFDSITCGRCVNCNWPSQMPDVTKTQCVQRPKPICNCDEKYSTDGYSCEKCPAGSIRSDSDEKVCVRPQCRGQYEIQFPTDSINCGRCDTCQFPQFAPNAQRTECVPQPLIDCPCLSRRSGLGYTCERCPQGMIQDRFNPNECVTPYCGGQYQITKPIDANSCGECEDCIFPRYIPNNEKTRCVLRPFADCSCLEKQSADRYSCEPCPYNQKQDPRNPQRCVDAPRCNVGNQIIGLADTQSCLNCRTCRLPEIPSEDRTMCYRPKPECSCTQYYSADGYSCLQCPQGQISDDARFQCYPAPTCYGPQEILGTRQNCYRCQNCPSNLVPNDTRTACVRPIPICTCTQKYSSDGYECQECPARHVVDPNNNKRCIPQNCSNRNEIFLGRDSCYRCQYCQQGYEPNPTRSECLRIKPTCSCTEQYDSTGYECIPCPLYHVATNQNQRCVPRQCSGLNQVLGPVDKCYQCRECEKGSTPDNLRQRCLRYITTECTCNQRFADNGYGCVDCPAGTRPSLDNRQCVSLNCDRDQILRRDLLCPQCEWCPPGSIPDPKREQCIVKPRPAINVNGVPSCDEYSVFNLDRTECIKCPNNLKASEDNLRCLNDCNDPLDIVQEDGTCFTCCNGNVPNYSRTRCVKKKNTIGECSGEREIYNSDRTTCTACEPYTRAQRQNTVCLADQCNSNQIITWLGTCANCLAGESKVDPYTCSGSSGTRLNAQLVEEPSEQVSSAAKKEKSSPTAVIAGLGVVVMILSAVTGMVCLRGREKTNNAAVQEQQAAEVSPANNDGQSLENLAQVMEKDPTDDSGSNGKNSE